MHAALDAIATEDPFGIKVQIERGATYVSMQVDFNANSDPIELASAASLLIANIASLKGHLMAWCKLSRFGEFSSLFTEAVAAWEKEFFAVGRDTCDVFCCCDTLHLSPPPIFFCRRFVHIPDEWLFCHRHAQCRDTRQQLCLAV